MLRWCRCRKKNYSYIQSLLLKMWTIKQKKNTISSSCYIFFISKKNEWLKPEYGKHNGNDISTVCSSTNAMRFYALSKYAWDKYSVQNQNSMQILLRHQNNDKQKGLQLPQLKNFEFFFSLLLSINRRMLVNHSVLLRQTHFIMLLYIIYSK